MNNLETGSTNETIATNATNAHINVMEAKAKMRADLESLGETLGQFRSYDSAVMPAEINLTRVVKCLYKATKDSKTGEMIPSKHENSIVRIPTSHINAEAIKENLDSLIPHIISMLETVEDNEIKESHKKGQLNVFVDGLSINSIIEKLDASNESARMNGEQISNWFGNVIAPKLSEVIADKLGWSFDELAMDSNKQAKVENVLESYCKRFTSLASPKVSIKEVDREAMKRAISLADAALDLVAIRFITRLDKMAESEKDALFAL